MEAISGDKYRCLESIFTWEEDVAFLATQPGYRPEIGRLHRIAKRKLACEWTRQVRSDFDELYRDGLFLLVHSDIDRPDLERALWRLKIIFYKRLFSLRLRLLWGTIAADEVRELSNALEHLIGYSCIVQDELGLCASN